MTDITKIRTSGTKESYDPLGIHKDTLYTTTNTNELYYNGKKITDEDIVDLKIADTLESSPAIVEAVTDLKNRLNDDEDVAVAVEKQIAEAKMKLFIDEWNAKFGIWGRYNEETGYFEGNGLTDITYEQARAILAAGPLIGNSPFFIGEGVFDTIRTNQPSSAQSNVGYNYRTFAFTTNCFSRNMEIVNLNPANKEADLIVTQSWSMINNAISLNVISDYTFGTPKYLGIIDLRYYKGPDISLRGYGTVQEIKLKNLHVDVKANSTTQGKSNISFESFDYWVKNRYDENPINIQVHTSVYSALTGDAEYPFNGGTREQWEQLLSDAADKNITFTT